MMSPFWERCTTGAKAQKSALVHADAPVVLIRESGEISHNDRQAGA
ncbi:MAG: hypothetical protein HN742_28850 [Lentisphaerae bacterium]|mgnify:CR=1 FL=1|jgi:hypothetical protein|nr:hypothetical protein [Lentisphaerota bacterium]MBT4820698.1 hypothetical protein [Lentisphaerota bacterium]MBT5611875.1 hypothetical protein [Lentisphaerota bacterium]MBT7054960.1 hypothetical protein [Lentisphaerota bacterium]MBT7845916.1 hypothetical protein [Lentisphaerota bacterium]